MWLWGIYGNYMRLRVGLTCRVQGCGLGILPPNYGEISVNEMDTETETGLAGIGCKGLKNCHYDVEVHLRCHIPLL